MGGEEKKGALRPGSTGVEDGRRPPRARGAGRRGAPGGAGPLPPRLRYLLLNHKGGERKGLGVEQLRGLLGGQLDVLPQGQLVDAHHGDRAAVDGMRSFWAGLSETAAAWRG